MQKKLLLICSCLMFPNIYALCVDINRATEKDFRRYLPHIGKVKARKILTYRHHQSGFTSLYELEAVNGLGPKYIEKYFQVIEKYFCYSSNGSGTSLG